ARHCLFEPGLLCRHDRRLQAFNRLPGRGGCDLSEGLARLKVAAKRGRTDAQILRRDAMAAKVAATESMAEERNTATLFDALLQSICLRLGYAPGGNRCIDPVVPRGLHRRRESAGRDIEMLGHVVDVGLTAGTARALRGAHGHGATGAAEQHDACRADDYRTSPLRRPSLISSSSPISQLS